MIHREKDGQTDAGTVYIQPDGFILALHSVFIF